MWERKALLLLYCLVALLASGAGGIRAQSPLDGFDPGVNNYDYRMVMQPDGKILLGGYFTSVWGVPRSHLARLNPDGTLDPVFNPNVNADANVYAIVRQADGKILVGGRFQSIGGQARSRIARLDPVTGTPDSFNPIADGTVGAITLQTDGKILVAGSFQGIGGQARNYLARLDPTTGSADSFNPNPDIGSQGGIYAIIVQPDGRILVGGRFTAIGGQARNNLARLDPSTGLLDSFNPNPSGTISQIVVQPDGKILVRGDFGSIGGQNRYRMARLDPVTGLADSFSPAPGVPTYFYDMALQPDGKILAGGAFVGTVGGEVRSGIARLDPNTGLADSFDPYTTVNGHTSAVGNAGRSVPEGQFIPALVQTVALQADGKVLLGGYFDELSPNGGSAIRRIQIARVESDGLADRTLDLNLIGENIYASAVQPDGKVVIAGSFSSVLGIARNKLARLKTDGTLDMAFDPNASDEVDAVMVQADGKILVGGAFTNIGGQTRNYLARLDPATGAADPFDANANDRVNAIAAQTDGKILVGGKFTSIGGQSRSRMARLDPTSGAADSFDPAADGKVNSIAVLTDGRIVVGGEFSNIGGQPRNHIARLDPSSGQADSFNPNADNFVTALLVQSDGSIVVGGNFSNIGGQARSGIARLNGGSGAADSFAPNADGEVSSLVAQADGKVIAGGKFTSIGGQARKNLARLDGTTGLADAFDAQVNNDVRSLALQTDGKILVGGSFTSVAGQARNHFARLTNDTAALQNLSATSSTIIWTRSGASAQLTRATFESSTDNVTYSPLGNGTAAGSNWTLNGLSLPTNQHFYLRARGYYRTGSRNGSESITESVRDAFITPPPMPTQVVSRKVHGGTPRDITLPLSGDPSIECRSGGATNDYQVVFTFTNAVTFHSAVVTAAAGTVSGSSGNGTTTVTVNLSGVTNAQRILVTLLGASDGTSTGDLIVPMGVLAGDTNGDGSVSASDVAQTKANSGQGADASNFRSDVNVSGSVSAADIGLVKSKAGTALP
jgi:uncharacterized delta-60 repeat protein